MKKESFFAPAREHFRKQNAFSMAHQSYLDCAWYPCHALPEGQDHLNCLFCYCPFYPCGNLVGTGNWVRGKEGEKVWDCSSCSFIHRDDVTALVMELFHQGAAAGKARKVLRKAFDIKNGRREK
jgi:Zn-finger protein